MFIGLGALAHVVLRLFGSRRKLRTSIGVSLLAGAHGLARWKGLVAGMSAVVAMAFPCGWLEHRDWFSRTGVVLGPHPAVYLFGDGHVDAALRFF